MLDVWNTVVKSSTVPSSNLDGICLTQRRGGRRHSCGGSRNMVFPDIHKMGGRV